MFELFLLLTVIQIASSQLIISPSDILLEVNETCDLELRSNTILKDDVILEETVSKFFDLLNDTILDNVTNIGHAKLKGIHPVSRAILEISNCYYLEDRDEDDAECPFDSLSEAFVRVTVVKSKSLEMVVDAVGWMYFVLWSLTFYPQIILNWRRKCVVGLSFDFLLLNIIGFTSYAVYNLLMYFSSTVQQEYLEEYPRSPLPVLQNDVFYALHAFLACSFTVFQCFRYDRGSQKISGYCYIIAGLLIAIGCISWILFMLNDVRKLYFVSTLSFIKMIVTFSKYCPQAYSNFERKSTQGWSIGQVLIDITGGFLAILQMILQASNAADWSAFYGNPVKCGLGLVSIIFDLIFMFQHYVLYRKKRKSGKDDEENINKS